MSKLDTYKARKLTTDEDDDDNGTFQQQALEIRLPGADFDPNATPTTGEEYLTHMAYERKRTPAIVSRRPQTAQIPTPREVGNVKQVYSASILSQEECAAQIREFAENSMLMLPTDEWKRMQVENFELTRNRVNSIRAKYTPSDNTVLPDCNDSNAWLEFCRQNKPVLHIILNLGQRSLEQLLDFMCEWLQHGEQPPKDVEENSDALELSNKFDVTELKLTTQWLGEWLFAVFACLHIPLEPEVHSTLREIARIAVRQRGHLAMPEEAKNVMIYNIFIQLIANVFGQLDFGDFI